MASMALLDGPAIENVGLPRSQSWSGFWFGGRRVKKVVALGLVTLALLICIAFSSAAWSFPLSRNHLESWLQLQGKANPEAESLQGAQSRLEADLQAEADAQMEAVAHMEFTHLQEAEAKLASHPSPASMALPLPHHFKPSEPFYCSTWNSATPAEGAYSSEVDIQYSKVAHYDLKRHPLPAKNHAIHSQAPPPPPHDTKSDSESGSGHKSNSETPKNMASQQLWKKPKGFQVIALVFFGRPFQVDILDCYLQQNMARHGGFLDEVHFIAHTVDARALAWLDNLVAATPDYRRRDLSPVCLELPDLHECQYERIWEHFGTNPDTLYIKIDDDINYIHPEAIPRLVYKRLEHPHPYAISVNLINSAIGSYLHYHTGAVYPYLPEPYPLPRPGSSPSWRPSELPPHPDDEDYQHLKFEPTNWDAIENSAIESDDLLYDKWRDAPFPGHRWLPLTQNSTSILHTPISRSNVDPFGPGIGSWAVSAQQHYSLLQNIENNTLHKYWLAPVPPLGDGLWYLQYSRYNLNFVAVWGKDIVLGANVRREGLDIVSEMSNDEKNITADIPLALGRPMVLDVQALAAHMNFGRQQEGMLRTDLLDRWRAYANENVCAPARQKGVPGRTDHLGWDEVNGDAGWPQCPWVQ